MAELAWKAPWRRRLACMGRAVGEGKFKYVCSVESNATTRNPSILLLCNHRAWVLACLIMACNEAKEWGDLFAQGWGQAARRIFPAARCIRGVAAWHPAWLSPGAPGALEDPPGPGLLPKSVATQHPVPSSCLSISQMGDIALCLGRCHFKKQSYSDYVSNEHSCRQHPEKML